jgi:hypothetical protein
MGLIITSLLRTKTRRRAKHFVPLPSACGTLFSNYRTLPKLYSRHHSRLIFIIQVWI